MSLGSSSIPYFVFLGVGVFLSITLPVLAAVRHRRMTRISDRPEDEDARKPL